MHRSFAILHRAIWAQQPSKKQDKWLWCPNTLPSVRLELKGSKEGPAICQKLDAQTTENWPLHASSRFFKVIPYKSHKIPKEMFSRDHAAGTSISHCVCVRAQRAILSQEQHKLCKSLPWKGKQKIWESQLLAQALPLSSHAGTVLKAVFKEIKQAQITEMLDLPTPMQY